MRKLGGKRFLSRLGVLFCLHLAAAALAAQEAYKIDEIKNPRCDLSEVPPIDPPPGAKFASALYKDREARGAVVVYGMEGAARVYADQVRERLNDYAGVSRDRVVTVYGGPAEDRRMELWVIPRGATEPRPNYVEDPKRARQFDSYSYWHGEYCGGGRGRALYTFAEALKRRPGWRGYIVVRTHRNTVRSFREGWDPDGYVSRREALRRAARDRLKLVKLGVPRARVEAVAGDNDEWTHAELWLIPPGAEPPAGAGVSSK